ncbi:MAG: hypothetical protein RR808_10065 [Akkermansia sp.]
MIKVMLDTCTMISLVKDGDSNKEASFKCIKYCLEKNFFLCASPIAVSEYSVNHSCERLLSLSGIRILQFGEKHAVKSAMLYNLAKGQQIEDRIFVKNDTKIIAHADVEDIDYLLTADKQMIAHVNKWRSEGNINGVRIVALNKPFDPNDFRDQGELGV